MSGIEVGRVNIAARGVGIAQARSTRRSRYARSARRSASRSRSHQAVQLMLAKMATRTEAARLLTRRGGAQEGDRASGQTSRRGWRSTSRPRPRRRTRSTHADPRRLRLLDRVPARAVLPRRAAAPDRRGLERDPAAHHRPPPARAAARELRAPPSSPRSARPCASSARGFPGEYWRALEPDRYPEEFVARADRERLARGADPGGVRRRGARR